MNRAIIIICTLSSSVTVHCGGCIQYFVVIIQLGLFFPDAETHARLIGGTCLYKKDGYGTRSVCG